MTDSTWQERAKALRLSNEAIALATGVSTSAVEKYKRGARTPKDPTWLPRVEELLDRIERAYELGGAA